MLQTWINFTKKKYRGITLTNRYKIYTTITEQGLQRDLEEREILTDTKQVSGTLENAYTVRYIIDQEINKEKEKIYARFANLTAAFDLVDRK